MAPVARAAGPGCRVRRGQSAGPLSCLR